MSFGTIIQDRFNAWGKEKNLERQLELHIEHIREGRSAEDILYEILLKSGFPLTTPVETMELGGKTVYSLAGGALLICLEKELTLELIRAIAGLQPERVVCLDAGKIICEGTPEAIVKNVDVPKAYLGA